MKKLSRRQVMKLAGTGLCAAAAMSLTSGVAAEEDNSPASAHSSDQLPKVAPPVAGPNAKAAVAMFADGFNCAQSVLASCGKPYGLSHEMGCRMGSAFVGGMGMLGLTCGAVTGAFMVVGLKHAQTDTQDNKPADEASRAVREFARRFKELHGSLCCSELLGHDISTPNGLQAIVDEQSFSKKCPVFVRDAAALVEEVLAAKAATPTQ